MKAYRVFNDGTLGYVCDIKHKLASGKFCDWSYTTDVNKALDLSKYWSNMFASDMTFVNAKFKLLEL